jgi:hypothetical protein
MFIPYSTEPSTGPYIYLVNSSHILTQYFFIIHFNNTLNTYAWVSKVVSLV